MAGRRRLPRPRPRHLLPERGPGVATADAVETAKAVCFGCDVREACFRYAMRHNIKHGVWGGTSVTDRRTIRRRTLRAVA